MSTKILSLIIPVYNMEKYLSQCLDSVILPEEEGSYEVIVVNDGSKDGSLAIANEYGKKYPDIITVIDKENGGYGSVFNVGINLAYGKYVKILDSDDYFDREVFSLYLKQLKSCSEDLVLNGILTLDDKNNHVLGRYNSFVGHEGHIDHPLDARFKKFFLHNFTFRRELLVGFCCPEHVLYTDICILLHGVIGAETVFWTNLDLYVYRVNRDGQSVALKSVFSKGADVSIVLDNLYDQLSSATKLPKSTMWLSNNLVETGVFQVLKNICLQKSMRQGFQRFTFEINRYKDFRAYHGLSNIRLVGFFIRLAMKTNVFYFFWHFYLVYVKKAKYY